MALEYPQVANVHLSAVEHQDQIVFLHAVQEGPASQSYGLQVARLAGVPQAVIRAARKRLAELESAARERNDQPDLFDTDRAPSVGADASEPDVSGGAAGQALGDALAEVDPDQLTPREALDLLYELKREATTDR